jgi:hypothetical protein
VLFSVNVANAVTRAEEIARFGFECVDGHDRAG